jgi:hypothetical protein
MQKIWAIALATSLLPSLSPPAQAQAQAIPAAVAACASEALICAVVVAGAGTWLLVYRDGRQLLCTWDGCRLQRSSPSPRHPQPLTMQQYTEPAAAKLQKDALRECTERAQLKSEQTGKTTICINVGKSITGGWICVFQEL